MVSSTDEQRRDTNLPLRERPVVLERLTSSSSFALVAVRAREHRCQRLCDSQEFNHQPNLRGHDLSEYAFSRIVDRTIATGVRELEMACASRGHGVRAEYGLLQSVQRSVLRGTVAKSRPQVSVR